MNKKKENLIPIINKINNKIIGFEKKKKFMKKDYITAQYLYLFFIQKIKS